MEASLDERTLKRIIALLVAFAGLAERAADRCFPVRFVVLLVLRHAEAVARDYVAEATLVDGLWFDDDMECTSSPVDALLLGQRFRWLAAVLGGVMEAAGRGAAGRPRSGRAGRHPGRRPLLRRMTPGHVVPRVRATGPPAAAGMAGFGSGPAI
jgi:hypothetical protein